MGKDDFFERFRALHEMDGKAPLNKSERDEYEKVKERFAEAICAAQRLLLQPGQRARATFRVALLFKLKLTLDGVVQNTATLDVSMGGFGARLQTAPSGDEREIAFEMFLTRSESISGMARIADARSKQRASFAFVDLKPASAQRLERLLFDEMLRQLVEAAVKQT